MDLTSGFADVSLAQLSLVAAVALFASIVGGVAGYGTGALMPLVLVPLIGAEPVVPIIAISAIFTNASRATAFRAFIEPRRALIVLAAAIPLCIVSAYGYTLLNNRGAMIVIGTMLILTVPFRHFMRRRDIRLGERGLAFAAAGWGALVGGTAGAGIVLLSLLMAIRPASRRGDRHRRGDLDRHRPDPHHGVRIGGRCYGASARLRAADRTGGVSRRVRRPCLRHAAAAARAHRDPRCGRGVRRRGDAFQCAPAVSGRLVQNQQLNSRTKRDIATHMLIAIYMVHEDDRRYR